MKNTFLKRISALALLVLLVLPITTVRAANLTAEGKTQGQPVGKSTVYIHDLADLLTDQQEQDLLKHVQSYCKDIQYNILFLTTNNAEGKTTLVYSDDYMDQLFPHDNENIAFVIDMDNRKIYINTMGTAIQKLSDDMIDKALDKAYPSVKNKDYNGCMKKMSSYCLDKLASAPSNGGSHSGTQHRSFFLVFLSRMGRYLVFSIVVAVIVAVALVMNHKKANRAQPSTTYVGQDDYEVTDKQENYIRTYETVMHDYYKKSSSSSGSHSGGSSHRSSSGRSHGGGGRSF